MATKPKPVGVAEGNWWQSAFLFSLSSAAPARIPHGPPAGCFPRRAFLGGVNV